MRLTPTSIRSRQVSIRAIPVWEGFLTIPTSHSYITPKTRGPHATGSSCMACTTCHLEGTGALAGEYPNGQMRWSEVGRRRSRCLPRVGQHLRHTGPVTTAATVYAWWGQATSLP